MSKSREESVSCRDQREVSEDLDRQYHQIGISAVVAALRYQGNRSATDRPDQAADRRGG